MLRKALISLTVLAVASALLSPRALAQFKNEAFSQSYNDDTPSQKDSTDHLFDFREFFGGLNHTREDARAGTMFAGSCVLLGGQQIHNGQYWKLPIVYGTTLGGLGAGIYFNSTDKADVAKWCFIGAGVAYWGTLMDGIVNYKPAPYPHPGKATIYSILLPGLGQAYNGEYWKIPLYVGGLAAAVHFYDVNNVNFQRFRNIYIESTQEGYDGPISSETAIYYRNVYRTYKDYSLVAIALVYLIQIIDANVFAYMHDFEINDDIALDVSPTVITPGLQLASGTPGNSAVGFRLGLTF